MSETPPDATTAGSHQRLVYCYALRKFPVKSKVSQALLMPFQQCLGAGVSLWDTIPQLSEIIRHRRGVSSTADAESVADETMLTQ